MDSYSSVHEPSEFYCAQDHLNHFRSTITRTHSSSSFPVILEIWSGLVIGHGFSSNLSLHHVFSSYSGPRHIMCLKKYKKWHLQNISNATISLLIFTFTIHVLYVCATVVNTSVLTIFIFSNLEMCLSLHIPVSWIFLALAIQRLISTLQITK